VKPGRALPHPSMQSLLASACRKCRAPVADALARRAALVPRPASGLLLDYVCEACGHRALYAVPGPQGQETRG
jgi:hypothetical protein